MGHEIIIDNGQGSANINNGSYSASINAPGYNNLSLSPTNIEVLQGVNEYSFTVSASGTLTLHVTEEGTLSGNAVVGAIFVRTDKDGNEYGNVITTNESGNAVFNNVPFSETGAPDIYYKQKSSDFNHTFNTQVVSVKLTEESSTIEVVNGLASERTLNLTDLNYNGLPIENATLMLS